MAHIVMISTADWDHPLWTNKQHVACALSDQGHSVLYVESLGLRGATSSGKDWFRILRRIKKALLPPQNVYKNIWVFSPLVIPGASNFILISINRILLALGIRISLILLDLRYEWLWTYYPLTARILNLKRFYKTIYHAVDAIQEQPRMPRSLILNEERTLCRQVDHVFVTSPQIERDLKIYSKRIKYYPNCCDYNHFSKALTIKERDFPVELSTIDSPIIGFIGAISNYKLDFSLINKLAGLHPEWNFVFIGPTCEGEDNTDISLLSNLNNIYLLGYRDYEHLPFYCAAFDIGWLPLKINSYTQSMFPMKFFEYLAAGLPVIATAIDSLSSFKKESKLCNPSVQEFSDAIFSTLHGSSSNLDLRMKLAKNNTYQKRTSNMIQDINNI